MKKMYTHKLSGPLPPSTVAVLGHNVTETSTSGFQQIFADGIPYMYKKKGLDSGLRSARNDVGKDGMYYISQNGTPPKKKAKYFVFSDSYYQAGVFNDYCQVDINGAYWNIALQKGYISFETYTKHKLNKIARNKALGTWAVKTYKSKYKGGFIMENDIIEKPTNPLFFDVSRYCFDVMVSCMRDYVDMNLFCWVDAIFCPKEIAIEIQTKLKEFGFGSSNDEIKFIISDSKKIKLYMNGKVKIFNLPPKDLNNFDHLINH